MKFSVLMSVYRNDKPEWLVDCLTSIFSQTLLADEVVLVIDGPISKELIVVIDKFKHTYHSLKVLPLAENIGLGKALNYGLAQCSNELVIRMDADDISCDNRFFKLVTFMENHNGVSACSSWIDEFIERKENVISTRKLPEFHTDLIEYAKHRNPLNHPAVIFRKCDVEEVGGYMHFPYYEDYYLWVRLLKSGYQIHNLQESLLLFRTSPEMYKRRGGWKYANLSAKFQYELYKIGFIDKFTAIKSSIIRGFVFLLPNSIRALIYTKLLR